jgi:hypothetical protein
VGPLVANGVAKWDGARWSTLGNGLRAAVLDAPNVSALAVSGGRLYAAGYFNYAGEVAANNIAMWDGNRWSALGSGLDALVTSLAVSGNDLYAAGNFTTAGGVRANHVAKWDGTAWSALGPGVTSNVSGLVVSGNDVYISGLFARSVAGAQSTARWDGTRWFPLGTALTALRALAVSGGRVYAGGDRTIFGYSVMKWEGGLWSSVGTTINGEIDALAFHSEHLYAGGLFTKAGGVAADNIAMWDGIRWSALGSGVNSKVTALAVAGDQLYVGGRFQTAGGKPSAFAAIAKIETR